MTLGRPLRDYLFTFVLWVLALAYTTIAFGYPADARIVPLLIGLPLIAITTIDLVAMTATRTGAWMRRFNAGGTPGDQLTSDDEPIPSQIAALGLVAGLIAMFVVVGAVVATGAYIAASLRLRGKFSPWASLAIGLFVAGCCYGVFEILLGIELYQGLLSDYWGS